MQHLRAYVQKGEGDTVTAVASSENPDREGESLKAEGWILDHFKENPVLLWAHDAFSLPIGKVTDIGVVGKQLVAKFVFAAHGFAQDVQQLVKDGFLNTLSVGFMPLERDDQGNTVKQELLELSIVNVPANADARVSRAFKSFQERVKTLETKEGRVLSEKNRAIIRNSMTSMMQAHDAMRDLMDMTEAPKKEYRPLPKKAPTRAVRALKLATRAIEVARHELKEGGVNK